jgi:glycosyltransferase involved in cell wall biosynthesis
MKEKYFSYDFLNKIKLENGSKILKSLPKISIVMPCLNHQKYVERSILSVLNQNYYNTELIIIDGGSDDASLNIIKKYEKYITFFISQKDQGQSDALNKGFSYATGDIYGWLNSDDLYLPGVFMLAKDFFLKNKNKKIIFGDWLSIDENDKFLDYNHAFDFNLNHFKYEGFHLNAQAMFWRSNVYKEFSGFDVNLYNTMDYQMILEFGITQGQNTFLRVPHVLGAFRRHNKQKTTDINSYVVAQHRIIAKKYGYMDKYELKGKFKRFYFRLRRCLWYLKRGGVYNLFNRLKLSVVKLISKFKQHSHN